MADHRRPSPPWQAGQEQAPTVSGPPRIATIADRFTDLERTLSGPWLLWATFGKRRPVPLEVVARFSRVALNDARDLLAEVERLRAELATQRSLVQSVQLGGTGYLWRPPDGDEPLVLHPAEVEVFVPAGQKSLWRTEAEQAVIDAAREVVAASAVLRNSVETGTIGGGVRFAEASDALDAAVAALDAVPGEPAPRTWTIPDDPPADVTRVRDELGVLFIRGEEPALVSHLWRGGGLTRPWAELLFARGKLTEDTDQELLCTGLTARWCPVHGTCTCQPDDARPDTQLHSSPDCPLHGPTSSHGDTDAG